MAKAASTEKNHYKATTGKEKAIKDPRVVVPKKPRLKQKRWYNKAMAGYPYVCGCGMVVLDATRRTLPRLDIL